MGILMAAVRKKQFVPKRTGKTKAEVMGLPSEGAELLVVLGNGLSYKVFGGVAERYAVDKVVLSRAIGIAPATLARRARARKFTPQESDRIYQVARVYQRAVDLFEGDVEKANAWMLRANPALGGEAPNAVLHLATGSRLVENLIGKLEHGVIV